MIVRKIAFPLFALASILSVTALSCSAASNLPNLFASATPTATVTFTPTVTPTITPSPTPTFTPTPQPTGWVINNLPGGGSQYLDYDAGMVIDVPADWVVVKLDPEDIQAAASSVAKDNPALLEALQNAMQSGAVGFRVFGFDRNPDHYAHGFVSNFSVLMSTEAVASKLPLDILIEASINQMKTQFPAAKVNKLGSKTNAHGLEIGLTEIRMPMKLPGGSTLNVYEKQMIFQTKKALVAITLSTPADKASVVTPLFDNLMDQIRLLEE